MKRLIYISFICLFLCGCSKNEENVKVLCLVNECYNEVANNNTAYCEEHINTKAADLYEQYVDNIKLTNTQLTECRAVVDEYIELVMSKNSNILAIKFINDTPETGTMYIEYRCNVIREDSNINLATIYVLMHDDGTFKVVELKYDK